MTELGGLLVAIGRQYPFNQDNYPRMPLTGDEKLLFAIRHIRDHSDKSWGVIAAAVEAQDHATDVHFSPDQLQAMLVAAAKLAVNAHQLMNMLGAETSQQQLNAMLAALHSRPS